MKSNPAIPMNSSGKISAAIIIAIATSMAPGITSLVNAQIQHTSISKEINTSSNYSRLCSLDDMQGFWRVMKWTPFFQLSPDDWKKTPYMRFQWILIGANGEFRTFGSNLRTDDDKVERILHKAPVVMLLTFGDENGIASMVAKDKSVDKTLWRCSLVTKNVENRQLGVEVKKGDIIMTMLAPNGNVVYYRQLRRVSAPTD